MLCGKNHDRPAAYVCHVHTCAWNYICNSMHEVGGKSILRRWDPHESHGPFPAPISYAERQARRQQVPLFTVFSLTRPRIWTRVSRVEGGRSTDWANHSVYISLFIEPTVATQYIPHYIYYIDIYGSSSSRLRLVLTTCSVERTTTDQRHMHAMCIHAHGITYAIPCMYHVSCYSHNV